MSGPSNSQSTRPVNVSDDRVTSSARRSLSSEPSEASSLPVTSSHGTSSPRSVLPTVSPTPAPPQQETRFRQTARMRVMPPVAEPRAHGTPNPTRDPRSSRLHPDDPYAAPPTRVSDRYTWQQHLGPSAPRADGAGPSRPVTGVPASYGLTHDQMQGLRNMAMDLRELHHDSHEQAHLLYQVSDAAHRLSENTIRVRQTADAASQTVQRLVSICLVMGALLAIVLLKMISDFFH